MPPQAGGWGWGCCKGEGVRGYAGEREKGTGGERINLKIFAGSVLVSC